VGIVQRVQGIPCGMARVWIGKSWCALIPAGVLSTVQVWCWRIDVCCEVIQVGQTRSMLEWCTQYGCIAMVVAWNPHTAFIHTQPHTDLQLSH